ncbi:hypothetical protein CISIN_1g0371361mg, partial [Citrus sinensis]
MAGEPAIMGGSRSNGCWSKEGKSAQ